MIIVTDSCSTVLFVSESEELKQKDFKRLEMLAIWGASALQDLLALKWARVDQPLFIACVYCLHSWTISRKSASCTAKLDRARRKRCTTMSRPAQPLRNSFSCWENEFDSKDSRSTVHSLTPKVRNTYTLLLGLFSSCCVDVHVLNRP